MLDSVYTPFHATSGCPRHFLDLYNASGTKPFSKQEKHINASMNASVGTFNDDSEIKMVKNLFIKQLKMTNNLLVFVCSSIMCILVNFSQSEWRFVYKCKCMWLKCQQNTIHMHEMARCKQGLRLFEPWIFAALWLSLWKVTVWSSITV